jgi:chromosome partitioning protein
MFSFRLPLSKLKPEEVSNLNKAIANADAFTSEVIERLREAKDRTAEEAA